MSMDAHISTLATIPKFWLGDTTAFDGAQFINSNRPIVVFDSGVGGLTVARQLEKLLPDTNILYVADNDWFPYGNKAGSAVALRVQQLFDELCTQVSPSAIVIACNTASIAIIENGLDQFRRNCFLITPPIDEALETSENKNIVLLATPSTLESRYIIQKITKAKIHARIWPIATQALVTLSETKLAGENTNFDDFAEMIDNHLTKEQRLSVDTVILGCTHFPHLIDDLRKIFPTAENWIDPAKKLASQVAFLTKKKAPPINSPYKITTFTSKHGLAKYHNVFSNNGFSTTPINRDTNLQ